MYYRILQLTVELHLLHSMDPYCSLKPTQQKVQWWYSSVTQGLSQRERVQRCVGGMVSGFPAQVVSPAPPDPHQHSHKQYPHSDFYTNRTWCESANYTLYCGSEN